MAEERMTGVAVRSSSVRRAGSDELSLLTVENRHLRFRVTRAGDSARGHRGLESGDLRRVKGDIETRQRVHELFARASSDGRDDRHLLSRALRPYPCDGKLRGGHALFRGDARKRIDERLVPL